MPGFLLDTNVISEFNRSQPPDLRVATWMDSVDEQELFVSVLTLGEIRFGIDRLPEGKRRKQLEMWLEIDVEDWFAGQILPVDRWIADRWGHLRAQARRTGTSLSIVDSLLAATAQRYDLTMVSRNEADFAATGLVVLNPWTS